MHGRKDQAAAVKQAESVKPAEPVQPNESKEEGKKVTCSRAHEKQHRLFIGNVPKRWTEDILRETMEKIGVGVTKVDLVMRKYGGCNKGFAFVEYRNHDCAKYSKEKMSDPRFKLDRNDDDPSSSQVKSIYVKNLPNNVTEDQLRRLFEHHGKITEVQLPTPKFEQEDRYGFVHFSERSGARKALRNSERYHVDGRVLECDLGKAQTVKKVATGPNTQKGPLPPNCPSQMDNMCRSRKCQNCQLILIAVVCLLLFIILVIACSGNGRFSKDQQINGKIQKLKFNLH